MAIYGNDSVGSKAILTKDNVKFLRKITVAEGSPVQLIKAYLDGLSENQWKIWEPDWSPFDPIVFQNRRIVVQGIGEAYVFFAEPWWGTTGGTQPAWNSASHVDGDITWTRVATSISGWQASTAYANNNQIVENGFIWRARFPISSGYGPPLTTNSRTSGTVEPDWSSVPEDDYGNDSLWSWSRDYTGIVWDNQIAWLKIAKVISWSSETRIEPVESVIKTGQWDSMGVFLGRFFWVDDAVWDQTIPKRFISPGNAVYTPSVSDALTGSSEPDWTVLDEMNRVYDGDVRWVLTQTITPAHQPIKAVVYDSDANLFEVSEEVEFLAGSTPDWYEFPFASTITLPQDCYIGLHIGSGGSESDWVVCFYTEPNEAPEFFSDFQIAEDDYDDGTSETIGDLSIPVLVDDGSRADETPLDNSWVNQTIDPVDAFYPAADLNLIDGEFVADLTDISVEGSISATAHRPEISESDIMVFVKLNAVPESQRLGILARIQNPNDPSDTLGYEISRVNWGGAELYRHNDGGDGASFITSESSGESEDWEILPGHWIAGRFKGNDVSIYRGSSVAGWEKLGDTWRGFVQLSWNGPTGASGNPPTAFVQGYKLYKGTVSGALSFLTTIISFDEPEDSPVPDVSFHSPSYQDFDIIPGVTYYYQIRAYNEAEGDGPLSAEVSITV